MHYIVESLGTEERSWWEECRGPRGELPQRPLLPSPLKRPGKPVWIMELAAVSSTWPVATCMRWWAFRRMKVPKPLPPPFTQLRNPSSEIRNWSGLTWWKGGNLKHCWKAFATKGWMAIWIWHHHRQKTIHLHRWIRCIERYAEFLNQMRTLFSRDEKKQSFSIFHDI